MELPEACERFVRWLDENVLHAARGDNDNQLDVEPSGKFWLGRLAPEARVQTQALGERGERLEPCAVGLLVQPQRLPATFEVTVTCRAWSRIARGDWQKSRPVRVSLPVTVASSDGELCIGADRLAASLHDAVGCAGLGAEVRIEQQRAVNGEVELVITLVNTSPAEHPDIHDTNLYETGLEISGLASAPYLLEALPDSFRYDRRVPAYGINCSVAVDGHRFATRDSVAVERGRPTYWKSQASIPDLTFKTLSKKPIPPLKALVTAFEAWGIEAWSPSTLASRASAEQWSSGMQEEAERGASDYRTELERMRAGLSLLEANEHVRRAFQLMNDAMSRSSRGRYDRWRPFQIGFLLANISCLTDGAESDVADIVWFATGWISGGGMITPRPRPCRLHGVPGEGCRSVPRERPHGRA